MEESMQIEAYLAGELSEAEVRVLERRMKEEPEFAAQVALQQDTLALLALHRQSVYKSQLQELDQQMAAPKLRPLWQRPIWAAAAMVLVLVLVGAWWINRPTADPFSNAFSPYPNRLTLRGAADEQAKRIDQGMTAYEQMDYALAANQLQLALATDPERDDLRFYLGVAQVGSEAYAEAILTLQQVGSESLYRAQADWYLVLAMGREGDLAAARELLQQMANQEAHPYSQQAADLLADLAEKK